MPVLQEQKPAKGEGLWRHSRESGRGPRAVEGIQEI